MSCLKNCIYRIRQQINRVEGELLKLEDFAACKKKDAFHNKCIKISNLTSILYSMTESLASNADTYFMDDVFSNKKSRNVYIKEENNEVIILLPELLPHRPRYDINTNKMKYDYDITFLIFQGNKNCATLSKYCTKSVQTATLDKGLQYLLDNYKDENNNFKDYILNEAKSMENLPYGIKKIILYDNDVVKMLNAIPGFH